MRDTTKPPVRCFVVGCPRSGTTLVQSRLALHSELVTFPETQLFPKLIGIDRYFSGLGRLRGWNESVADVARLIMLRMGYGRTVMPHYQQRLQEIGDHLDCDAFRSWRFPPTRRLAALVQYAIERFDTIASEQGKAGWIEKTPTHLRYTTQIARYVGHARVVHVVRDGRATVASIWEACKKDYPHWRDNFPTLDACIRVWNSDLRRTLKACNQPDHVTINYHRFCAAPEQGCGATWDLLGLPPSQTADAEQDDVKNSSHATTLPYETWKEAVTSRVDDYGLDKFHKTFSPDEQRHIEKSLINGGDIGAYDTTV